MFERWAHAALLGMVCLVGAPHVAGAQTPFTHSGIDANHPGSSVLPFEQVDPASGQLAIVATDLVLPGNAGLDLRVQRVYNSGVFPDYSDGSTELEEDSWAGIGWTLHFGRVLYPDAAEGGRTQIEMSDGGRHALYHAIGGGWITKDFWLYDKTTHVLRLPNGLVYTFGHAVHLNDRFGVVRYVTEIRDPYNNRLTFTYASSPGPPDGIAQIQQHLGGGQVRTVTFTYGTTGIRGLATMVYGGRTWYYYHTPVGSSGHSLLTRVQPPGGAAWEYGYGSGLPGELTSLSTPLSGLVTYTYGNATRRAGPLEMTTRVVTSRSVGGWAITPGTWTYSYGTGPNQDTSVVACPCGTTRYRFSGTGLNGTFAAWSAGSLVEQTVEQGGTVLERRTFTWAPSEMISSDPVEGVEGVWTDGAVHRALLVQSTVTRGSQTWSVQHEYQSGQGRYNDYGRPWRTWEHGATAYQYRRTIRAFRYGFAPYIVDRVQSVELLVSTAYNVLSGPVAVASYQYDLTTGFMTQQNTGVPVTFERTAQGNVAAVIDARGNRTNFTYTWGAVASVQTPGTQLTFSINPDGLVVSASNGVDTPVTYSYEPLFRVIEIAQAGTNPVSVAYHGIHNRRIRTTRGASETVHDLDGFGRVYRTSNAVGVKVNVERDACGRLVFESLPHSGEFSTVGTRTQFDALHRATQITDPSGALTRFTYGGGNFTRIDAENRSTSFEFMAFGDPGAARLVAVQDAAGVTTSYSYDVFEGLTGVTGPAAGLTRSWSRDFRGLLVSETHPESATTTYVYDAAGNLTERRENGRLTTFTYDSDNRLVTRTTPFGTDDLTVTYNAAGRIATMTASGTTTTLQYDNVGRLQQRRDVTGALTFTSSHGFDANDRLVWMAYPSGRQVAYDYDAEGRITAVRQNGTIFADTFTYNARGLLASYRTGAVTHTFTYDTVGRTARIVAAGGTPALDLTYTYDLVGNVRAIADPRPGASQSFTLDALDRMTGATGPWGALSWTYDAAGNRLTENRNGSVTSYVYSLQRLMMTQGANAEPFDYDDVGRLTKDQLGSRLYTPAGLLARVMAPGVDATYAYDPAGLRLSRTVNGDTTYTIRSAGGEVLTEYTGSCGPLAWAKDTIYAGGRPLGAVRSAVTAPSVGFVSSAVSVSEAAGSVALSVRLTSGAPITCPITVSYQTVAGTATAGSDFTPVTGTVTFPAGSANGTTQILSVPILNDNISEPNETFTVRLRSASGIGVTTSDATVTIVDDDPVSLSIADVSLLEGHSGLKNATFTVTLSRQSAQTVQVSYATSNGTALAGSDYYAVSGILTIPAGALTGTIVVQIVGDVIPEPDETFFVTLSSPVNATISRAQATGTIVNDDADNPPRLTWGDFVVPRDGKADATLWQPGTGLWTMRDSASGAISTVGPWGASGDIYVPADYTGNGKTDCAVYRPSTGVWWIAPSCDTAQAYTVGWGGQPSDVPVPADYDGDGKVDLAVYRRAQNLWYVLYSSGGSAVVEWGWTWTHVIPTPGDYNGDGRADFAYYAQYNSSWWILLSTGQGFPVIDGTLFNQPVVATPGDYDGDGRTDGAYFYPAANAWYIVSSATGVGQWIAFGNSSQVPVAADYDGDGKTDVAMYDPATRIFWIRQSSTLTTISINVSGVSQPGAIPVLRRPQ